MANSDTRRLRVVVTGDSKDGQQALKQLGKEAAETEAKLKRLGTSAQIMATKINESFAKVRKFDITPTLQDTKFKSDFRIFARTFLNDQVIKIQPRLAMNALHIGRELKKAGMEGTHTFKVRPILDLAKFKADFAIFRANYLQDRSFNVSPNLNNRALANAVARLGAAGSQGGQSFVGGFLGHLPFFYRIIAGLALTVLLNLTPILGLLGELTTATIALGAAVPFAMTAVAAAAGVVTLAFMGVKDSLKEVFASNEKDIKKLEEALKNLAPAARHVILEIRKYKEEFVGVQQAVQQAFFLPLKNSIGQLVTTTLPVLRSGMVSLSTIFGSVAAAIVQVVTASAKSGQITVIFAGINKIAASLATVMPGLVSTFLKLAQAAIPFATALNTALVGGLQKFVDLVAAAAADGRLKKLFEDGLEVLRNLGAFLSNVGSIAMSVFHAFTAGGEPVLGMLAKMANNLAVFLKTAEGTAALETVVHVLGTLGSVVSTIVLPLLPAVGKLISVLGGPLIAVIDKLLGPVGNLVDIFGRSLIAVLDVLSPHIDKLAGQLGDFLVIAVTELAAIMRQMMPTLIELAKRFGPEITPLIAAFFKAMMSLVPLLPEIARLLLAISPILIALIPVVKLMMMVMTTTFEAIAFLIREVVMPAIRLLVDGFIWMIDNTIPSLRNIRDFFIAVWNAIVAFFQEKVAVLRTAFAVFIAIIVSLWVKTVEITDALKAKWNGFITWLVIAFQTGKDGIAKAWQQISDAAKNPVKFVVEEVYNQRIRLLWNTVAEKFGLKARLDPIKGFETGGIIPGARSKRDNTIIAARTGEGVAVPELVDQIGASRFLEWNRRARQGRRIEGFEDGGIVGWGKALFGKAKDIFQGLAAEVIGPLVNLVRGVISRTPPPGPGMGEVMRNSMNMAVTGLVEWVKGKDKEIGPMGAMGGGDSGTGRFTPQPHGWPPRRYHVLSPNTAAAKKFIDKTWGGRNNPDHLRVGPYDHPWGKAIDNMADIYSPAGRAKGNSLAAWFVNNPKAFGTKYVIWNRRITDGGGWRGYVGDGPHTDHVHTSFFKEGGIVRKADNGAYLPPGSTATLQNATRGGEFALTEDKMRGLAGVHIGELHVHFDSGVSQGDAAKIAKSIRDELVKLARRNGGNAGLPATV